MPLGDYERLECVGKGNQGSVYRVLHRATGRTFVLKRAELDADDPTLRAAALREAETLGSLQHACVVRYEESFVELDGERAYICIVMEYCAGGDLHRRVEQAAAVVAKGLASGAAPASGPPLGFFPEAQVRPARHRAAGLAVLMTLGAWALCHESSRVHKSLLLQRCYFKRGRLFEPLPLSRPRCAGAALVRAACAGPAPRARAPHAPPRPEDAERLHQRGRLFKVGRFWDCAGAACLTPPRLGRRRGA